MKFLRLNIKAVKNYEDEIIKLDHKILGKDLGYLKGLKTRKIKGDISINENTRYKYSYICIENKIIGIIDSAKILDSNTIYIRKLEVCPKFRKNKIATKLLKLSLNKAYENKLKFVKIRTTKDNYPFVIKWYSKVFGCSDIDKTRKNTYVFRNKISNVLKKL
jgi:predicted acetyltransferase